MTTPPWAEEPGLFKVVCGCGGEAFTFVITDFTIAMVCLICHQTNGKFDRPHGWEPFVDTVMGGVEPATTAAMDRTPGSPPPPPNVHVGWISDGTAPTPAEWQAAQAMRDTMAGSGAVQDDDLAKLGPPEASPEHANAILQGGTWPGRLLALPGDVMNVGLPDGMYRRLGQDEHGRWIYQLDQVTFHPL